MFVFNFAMSPFQDGVILAADTPAPSDAVAHHPAADFKFFPATCTLPAAQNLERSTLMALVLLCHEAKAEPDMVVSAVAFRAEDIFGSEERKEQRFVCGNLKEVPKPLPKNPTHLSAKAPKLTSGTSEKQCGNPSIIPSVKAKFQSS